MLLITVCAALLTWSVWAEIRQSRSSCNLSLIFFHHYQQWQLIMIFFSCAWTHPSPRLDSVLNSAGDIYADAIETRRVAEQYWASDFLLLSATPLVLPFLCSHMQKTSHLLSGWPGLCQQLSHVRRHNSQWSCFCWDEDIINSENKNAVTKGGTFLTI